MAIPAYCYSGARLCSANLPALAPAGKQEPNNHENDNDKQTKNDLANSYDVVRGYCCAGLAPTGIHTFPSAVNEETALLGGFSVHLSSQCAGLVLPNRSRALVNNNDKEIAKQNNGQHL